MSTVYVIHADADASFVKEMLRPLPSNGYDSWLTVRHLTGAKSDKDASARAMDRCHATLAVLSPAILQSSTASREIESALAASNPLIAVQCASLSDKEAASLPAPLWAMPKIDFTQEEEIRKGEAVRLLIALLPPAEPGAKSPKEAERISWNEEIFSGALASATGRHDHARAEFLVSALASHLLHRPYPYPGEHAASDLHKLRQDRDFELMRRYAEAVIASGTRLDKVRRLFAQALIETGQHARALDALKSIIEDKDSSQSEIFEAHGLMGRSYKKRYVDAPTQSGADKLLQEAIKAYKGVYDRDPSRYWHGVNAASCILRAKRDAVPAESSSSARKIAQQIVKDLDPLAHNESLQVCDRASHAEALIALDRYEEASRAVEAYIHHPDMTAFEVSSTFRQFDQVLQLGADSRGQLILDRLRATVERYRAGRIPWRDTEVHGSLAKSATSPRRPLIIRLANADWDPKEVADLEIHARLGKIVTARGSDKSVRELLSDSNVISIDESRPAGSGDCDRSMPFIRIAAEYASPAGNFKEKGDRALIAIIDDGIDVLHKAFLDSNGRSRILGIWDQADSSGSPPQGCDGGTFHDATAIARFVESGTVPRALGRDIDGHGTHVASIAAGRPVGGFAGGVAPEAKMLVVVSAGTTPIGYSKSHIDALMFIERFATQQNLPVVVNVSQGMNAGAHDGKSALEAAFDGFAVSGRKEGRAVVKSAGNERDKRGHAKVTLPPDAHEDLKWKRAAGADLIERIELWWNSASKLRFRLGDPHGQSSDWVETAAPEREGTFVRGGPYRLLFTPHHVDNGDSLLVVELGSANFAAAVGDWCLEIESCAAPKNCEIHAWIERTQGVPSSFLNHSDEGMTLSIPGTASSVITVGAVDASWPIRVGGFSSYGPTRDGQNKPVVCAPGVDVWAAQGGTADGTRKDRGTSMAAPHVSGAIALLFSKTAKAGKMPSANQVAAVLRQKTQRYNGSWDPGQGYGLIDVGALLAAF